MKKILLILFTALQCIQYACNKQSDSSSSTASGTNAPQTGIGGSTARFAVVGDILYTVDHEYLNIFDIKNPAIPKDMGNQLIGFDIETIFPRDDSTLFIGSQNGMYIYNVKNPLLLSQSSFVSHFRSCDPVVANNKYAFVTLNSEGSPGGRRCWGNTNVLITYDVTDLKNVITLKTYNLTKPKGLGLLGNNLFVCDNLLRWYDASNPSNLISKDNFAITANDIIPLEKRLILVGNDGITQLGFEKDSIWFLSKIASKIQ